MTTLEIIFLYMFYTQTSVMGNYLWIRWYDGDSIPKWPGDLFQSAFTILLVTLSHGISWQAVWLGGILGMIYYILFDPELNLLRGKPIDYRNQDWYDNILPQNIYAANGIKLILLGIFITLYLYA